MTERHGSDYERVFEAAVTGFIARGMTREDALAQVLEGP